MSGYPPPQPAGGYFHYPESSKADVAVICTSMGALFGVIGVCCLPVTLAAMPLLFAGGWIGHAEVSAIDAGRRDPRKRQSAELAKWFGIVGAVLTTLLIVITIAWFGFSFVNLINT